MYKCPRCGNEDPRYIGYINGKPYCRRCISYNGRQAKENKHSDKYIPLKIDYRLSKSQFIIANKVKENFINGKDSLIHAVTGAGKTELVYFTMEYALSKKMNVGFAVPRRDVVIDLFPRIASAFPDAKTVYVIGNHSKVLNGDIILLTTHQLYRYPSFFDLLIIDEIDAFPYKGDSVLNKFALDSVRGNRILLSATPDKEDVQTMDENGKVFTMLARYHRHPLPVPSFIKASISMTLIGIRELKRLIGLGKQVFFFMPTIKQEDQIGPLIKSIVPNGEIVNSEKEGKDEIIESFKKGQLSYLITTSILERGVTVKGLQVIVFNADHVLYTKDALIQIAGRAGRKKEEAEGEVIFIGKEESDGIRDAIQEIKDTNAKAHLQGML